MTQKLWQKKLKLDYSKDVLDIVHFGSSVLEGSEPNDLDVAVIFKNISVKEQLEERQKIKNQIQKHIELPVHIESFDINSFFDKGNFARGGVLFYGKSLISGKNFSENFGLIPKLMISYVLKDLKKKDKVKFNYMLNGKGGSYGLLRKFGGSISSPGTIEISPEYESIFLKPMKKITPKILVERVFVSK
ncbi:MAG: hypothetical protein WCP89_04305 [archaeon]